MPCCFHWRATTHLAPSPSVVAQHAGTHAGNWLLVLSAPVAADWEWCGVWGVGCVGVSLRQVTAPAEKSLKDHNSECAWCAQLQQERHQLYVAHLPQIWGPPQRVSRGLWPDQA